MLDFGFSEILLTSAIALVVLGPERLPKVARQVGNWMGRARAMARQLSEQLEREVSADELMKAQTRHLQAPMVNRIAPPQAVTLPTVPSQTPHLEYTPPSQALSPEPLQPPRTAEQHAASSAALRVETASQSPESNSGVTGSVAPTAVPESAYGASPPLSAVPDLHALPPEASPTPHADPRNPPNE